MAPSRIAAASIGLIAALLLGSTALLSLIAAFRALPAAPVVESVRQGRVVSEQKLVHAARASYAASRIFEPGRYLTDAVLIASRLMPEARKSALGQLPPIETMLDEALVRSPASPHNWARRAGLLLAAGKRDEARQALEASIMTGRFVPGLTVPRLRLLVALAQPGRDGEVERLFAEQVRLAAASEPAALARFANGGRAEGMTQRVLMNEPEMFAAYLRALAAERRKARR